MESGDCISNLLPDLVDLYNKETAYATLEKLQKAELVADKDGNIRAHRRYKHNVMTLVAIELTKLVIDSSFNGNKPNHIII